LLWSNLSTFLPAHQVSNLSIELEDLRQQLLAERASGEERSAKEACLANQVDAMSAQFESLESALASAVAEKQALGKQQKAMAKAFAKERAGLEDAVRALYCTRCGKIWVLFDFVVCARGEIKREIAVVQIATADVMTQNIPH